tara:strand:+ start:798 stop:1199 length:402 start_codon:yes stop_codon:yes gene_type:complete
MTEQFTKESTKDLQIESLLVFAETLGYVPNNIERLSQGFKIIDFRSWHTHYISFRDMCKLHNGFIHRQVLNPYGKVVDYDFIELKHLDINTESLEKAWLKRKVKRVKLQPTKYKYKSVLDGVICQEDTVEYIK